MRVGVVGCGYWGSKHVRVLSRQPEVDAVALIDPNHERRSELRAAFHPAKEFEDLESALPDVDAVVIATPPRSHEELAMIALGAGKHVLVEKPVATSVSGAVRLVEEAEAQGLVLMAGHTYEFNPAVWELRKRIQSGELGDLHYLDSARLSLGIYQQDVNVVWDLAPHDVSIVNFLLDSVPTSVTAWASRHAHADLEDLAWLRLHYGERDITAYVHVSWLDPAKVRRLTVVGSQKMAVYNDLANEERIRIFDRGVQAPEDDAALYSVPMSYRHGDIVSPFIPFEEPLMLEAQHFVNCVREGRRPSTDGRSGLAVVAVLEAAEKSIQSGGPVQVESPLLRMGLPTPITTTSSLPPPLPPTAAEVG